MLAAIASLTVLGAVLGLGLGVAARKFAVEGDPLADEIAALMPGSNCGQCGMAGCAVAAAGIADGSIPVTGCPPGGPTIIRWWRPAAAISSARLAASCPLTSAKSRLWPKGGRSSISGSGRGSRGSLPARKAAHCAILRGVWTQRPRTTAASAPFAPVPTM